MDFLVLQRQSLKYFIPLIILYFTLSTCFAAKPVVKFVGHGSIIELVSAEANFKLHTSEHIRHSQSTDQRFVVTGFDDTPSNHAESQEPRQHHSYWQVHLLADDSSAEHRHRGQPIKCGQSFYLISYRSGNRHHLLSHDPRFLEVFADLSPTENVEDIPMNGSSGDRVWTVSCNELAGDGAVWTKQRHVQLVNKQHGCYLQATGQRLPHPIGDHHGEVICVPTAQADVKEWRVGSGVFMTQSKRAMWNKSATGKSTSSAHMQHDEF